MYSYRYSQRKFTVQEPQNDGRSDSSENGINWADGHTEYKDLHTVFTEAVTGFANLYAYGVSKFTFPSSLAGRTIHNLLDMDYPTPDSFNHKHWCTVSSHEFPKIYWVTKAAHSLYDWLMHYQHTKV